jgi:DNA repair exonuclease SbcCD nuclease subunit
LENHSSPIADNAKREALRKQRVDTIRGLKSAIESESLDFVVVCGDLFDSFTPDKATVSALCSAIGELKVPVYAIPGNHDHGDPGCIWEQAFFKREQEQLPQAAYDYIALGDWHGMKQISEKAWFSGTPEQDRFAKGDGNQPAYALTVEIKGRSQPALVNPVQTGKIGWHALAPVQLNSDQDLDELELRKVEA